MICTKGTWKKIGTTKRFKKPAQSAEDLNPTENQFNNVEQHIIA